MNAKHSIKIQALVFHADEVGKSIANIPQQTEIIQTVNLNYNELIEFREKFTVGFDWDKFEIIK